MCARTRIQDGQASWRAVVLVWPEVVLPEPWSRREPGHDQCRTAQADQTKDPRPCLPERAQLTHRPFPDKGVFLARLVGLREIFSANPALQRQAKKTGQQTHLPLPGSLDGPPGPLPMHLQSG